MTFVSFGSASRHSSWMVRLKRSRCALSFGLRTREWRCSILARSENVRENSLPLSDWSILIAKGVTFFIRLRKHKAARAVALSLAHAYAKRVRTSSPVKIYTLLPSRRRRCIVSSCTKSPGCCADGRGGDMCRLLCQRFLRSPCRSSVRFTEHRDTSTPSSLSAKWTTSADRLSSNLFSTILRTNSYDNCFG